MPAPVMHERARQSGYSMVELMVAVTVGLVILAGLAGVFANNSRARAEIDRANQQVENGRYAMQVIGDDLRNAGFLSTFDPTPLATPSSKPDPCLTTVAAIQSSVSIAVQGYDNGASAPTCLSDVRTGTDILVVRRASSCAVGALNCDAQVAGDPYFQASGCNNSTELASGNVATYYGLDTTTTNLTLHQKDCTTAASLYQYRTHIYYVANDDKTGDGIPTLKRAEMVVTGGALGFNLVPIAEGVENLQIEYGLDTSSPTSGSPAVYTANPDIYNTCTPAVCAGYWRNTVAVKINILARNTSTTPGFTDSKTYMLGLNADGSVNTVGPFSDGYKRHAYESVVRVNNVAGRNL